MLTYAEGAAAEAGSAQARGQGGESERSGGNGLVGGGRVLDVACGSFHVCALVHVSETVRGDRGGEWSRSWGGWGEEEEEVGAGGQGSPPPPPHVLLKALAAR
jgi:hypothetical protein